MVKVLIKASRAGTEFPLDRVSAQQGRLSVVRRFPSSLDKMRRPLRSREGRAAGIPRTRRKLYLGHGQTDVTDLHEWHEVRAFVIDDRAKLQAYIGREQRKAVKVMK